MISMCWFPNGCALLFEIVTRAVPLAVQSACHDNNGNVALPFEIQPPQVQVGMASELWLLMTTYLPVHFFVVAGQCTTQFAAVLRR